MNLNQNNLNAILALGRTAAERVLDIYKQDFSVHIKADDSPLTLADQDADRIFQEGLAPFGLPIISEESPIDLKQNFSTCWVVDPIDGTKEFVARNGMFTLNVALVDQGIPILGLLIAPAYQGRESGAWLGGPNLGLWHWSMDEDWVWHPDLAQVKQELPGDSVRMVGSRSDFREHLETWKQHYAENQNLELLKVGSSLKFTFIAKGKADFYPRSHNLSAWDIAAGHALVLGGGGRMLQLDNQEPLIYKLPDIVMPGFLAEAKKAKR